MAVAMLAVAVGSIDRAMAQQTKPIRIGVNTAIIQAQVRRDTIDSVKMAIMKSTPRAARKQSSLVIEVNVQTVADQPGRNPIKDPPQDEASTLT
jgi:hypothetical protein